MKLFEVFRKLFKESENYDQFDDIMNFSSASTGLPFTIFVFSKYDSPNPFLKVGNNLNLDSVSCTVSIAPKIEIIKGRWTYGPYEFERLKKWIEINQALLIKNWSEVTYLSDFINGLKKV